MSFSISIQECAAVLNGKLLTLGSTGFSDGPLTGVATDTRKSMEGEVFFALVGEQHDAHEYLEQAIEKGARALIVHQQLSPERMKTLNHLALTRQANVAIIQVKDTLLAFQDLANHWRKKLKALFIGITGTNGKTSTKEFLAAILSAKMKVQWSRGSFNNHWGVPITIFSVGTEDEVAIIEMGMNHPGELKTLVKIAEPNIVGCTMVGRGHLEGVGSIEGVAAAKFEIYETASEMATMVFNLDNSWTSKMRDQILAGPQGASRRTLTFSSQITTADVQLTVRQIEINQLEVQGQIKGQTGRVVLQLYGEHNATNLMMAAALALTAGMSPNEIWEALPRCKAEWGRNQWIELQSKTLLLFDAYNANPESMKAALSAFKKVPCRGRKILLLGEMRELGEATQDEHRTLAETIVEEWKNDQQPEILFFGQSHHIVNEQLASAKFKSTTFSALELGVTSPAQIALLKLKESLRPEDLVLVKASRGVGLERAVQILQPLGEGLKKS